MIRRLRGYLVAAPAVVGAIVLWRHSPIPQDPGYHHFADQRSLGPIPHAGDVLSNAAFLFAGAAGLLFLSNRRSASAFSDGRERLPYAVFFCGVFLTGLGSAWYHLAPDTKRLFWDRLPMTVAFLSFFSAILAERVGVGLARLLLWPLIAIGAWSVLFWRATERTGHGDLRPYALVQYYPVVAIALLLLLYPSRYDRFGVLWWVAGMYAAAKLFEIADWQIFRLTKAISGHTLKHIAAGVAAALVVEMLWKRRPLEEKPKEKSS